MTIDIDATEHKAEECQGLYFDDVCVILDEVRRLRSELDASRSQVRYFDGLHDNLACLAFKLEIAVAALKFYAECPSRSGMIEGQINGGERIPLGTKAREALEQIEGEG